MQFYFKLSRKEISLTFYQNKENKIIQWKMSISKSPFGRRNMRLANGVHKSQ